MVAVLSARKDDVKIKLVSVVMCVADQSLRASSSPYIYSSLSMNSVSESNCSYSKTPLRRPHHPDKTCHTPS